MDDLEFTTAIHPLDKDKSEKSKRQCVLIVMSGPTTGQTIYLETKDKWSVGRATESDIVFPDASVSRNHCQVRFDPPKNWVIEDLQSSNGTWINGEKIESSVLRSNDKIQIGSNIILKFVLQDEVEDAFQRELYESATKDALTGLWTKRHFLEHLETEFNYHRRVKKPLSVIMCDLDHFKKINDNYGHLGGDLVLKELGGMILNVLRRGDSVGRYGGEEIIFFLRETPLPGAKVFSERLRMLVENHPFIFEGKKIPATISIGVATCTEDNYSTMHELIKAADEFLYKAKQTGRNKVVALH